MQRRTVVMDGDLVRHPQPVPCFIKKDNALRGTVFHEGARYQQDLGFRAPRSQLRRQLSRPLRSRPTSAGVKSRPSVRNPPKSPYRAPISSKAASR